MSQDSDPRTDFLNKLVSLRRWGRGDVRAPHKPLLILMALGRVQGGGERFWYFSEIEKPLTQLLRDFGPARVTHHPIAPFWRLRRDALWEIPQSPLISQTKSGDAHVTSAREKRAQGGFPAAYYQLLKADPGLIVESAKLLLERHFTPSLHEDIALAVGLDLEVVSTQKRRRDPAFRRRVLAAYEYRCAVCGLDSRLGCQSVALEACHVRWACHDGPAVLSNGLCLCSLHHKALDTGAIGLSEDYKILVSEHLHGGEQVERLFLMYSGRPLREPQEGKERIAAIYQRWHWVNIFRREARPPAA